MLGICSIHSKKPSIREQLQQMNTFWFYHPLVDSILDKYVVFDSDVALIQLHLKLVEVELRKNCKENLSSEQKNNRLRMLDVLRAYWLAGKFPKNTVHKERMPYFIDIEGTACAVGQLIITSGYSGVAEKISKEHNNGYIHDLIILYPDIINWAYQHGFTIEELAWIQPCYAAPPDTAGLRHPSCHSANNGYFYPDFTHLQGPLTKAFYRWSGTSWLPWTHGMCGGWLFYACIAGKYKWEVKDNLNITHTYTTELIAPLPATVTVVKSGNFNACEGLLTASALGGVGPYLFRYFINGKHETVSLKDSVCEQNVYLTFYESCLPGGLCSCPQFFDIQTGTVGLDESAVAPLIIAPNPVSDILWISFEHGVSEAHRQVKVFNNQGHVVLKHDLQNGSEGIDVRRLAPGFYILVIDGFAMQRFIKE